MSQWNTPVEDTPIALTIAGSDSGGGAGIQADLKTFHQWGVFGTSAVTAVTAQNTRGVDSVQAIATDLVAAQIRSVVTDLPPTAVKTGMLATAEVVSTVGRSIRELGLGGYVLDPVMVSTTGHRLLEDAAVEAIKTDLIPLARLVTPNWPEAAILTGVSPGPGAQEEAARRLVDAGAGAALIKGGHLEGAEVRDVFWDGEEEFTRGAPKVETPQTHGTGCTLSAAIVANLALGRTLARSVALSVEWVQEAIATAPGLGHGRGPLNHWAPTTPPGFRGDPGRVS